MIPIAIDKLASEVGGVLQGACRNSTISGICIDSRIASPTTIFVALKGRRADGHEYLRDAFNNGAAAAIVSEVDIRGVETDKDWVLIVVPSPLGALQKLAEVYREAMLKSVVAITGSNGKTITKDALKALVTNKKVASSPGSYNGQLGLPLAILATDGIADLGILEVAISEPGEMARLEQIVRPDFGILTNIGLAHIAAFGDRRSIALEKMKLFARIPKDGWVLLPQGEGTLDEFADQLSCKVFRVGPNCPIISFKRLSFIEEGQLIEISAANSTSYRIKVKSRSPEIASDLHFASAAALLLGVAPDEIASALAKFEPIQTRMEQWSSPDGVRVISDAYSSDPISLGSALKSAALGVPEGSKRFFAFSGMLGLGQHSKSAHKEVGILAGQNGFNDLVLVRGGDVASTADGYTGANPDRRVSIVDSAEQLKDKLISLIRPGDTVFFNGPQNTGMVQAAQDLSGSIAQRCLRVDLGAIESNLAKIRSICGGKTQVMAMLKALAYGTDLVQLAYRMSRLSVRHIGVSSTQEGVDIRKAGADQEIYVFLADRHDTQTLLRHGLTPIIYSPELASAFAEALCGVSKPLNVHLKVDTGMHRLGVSPSNMLEVVRLIKSCSGMRLTGICTHFASADEPSSDDFTRRQLQVFNEAIGLLRSEGFKDFQVHAANTAAAMRFPESRFDMVRIGIGLYGIYPSKNVQDAVDLELAIGVTSRIASIQTYQPGDTLGYNRTYTVDRPLKVGVVPFGYDDGLPWRHSGRGYVLVEGQRAPIVGRISMDQFQVDLSGVEDADIGAEVLIYGKHGGHELRPEVVAQESDSIPHELLIRLGRRVQRIYIEP